MKQKKTKRSTLIALSLIALGFAVTFLQRQNDSIFKYSKQIAVKEEVPAPDFALPDLNGELVRLAAFKGNVVLVNIWASW